MPIRIEPQCYWCKHFDLSGGFYSCKAFARIPREIWRAEYDHRRSHPHDNGTLFERLETQELIKRKEFEGYTKQEIDNALILVEKDLDALNALEDREVFWEKYFASEDDLLDDLE